MRFFNSFPALAILTLVSCNISSDGSYENYTEETDVSPVYEESIDGVYSYTEPNFEAYITISGSSWTGRTTLYGETEYERGIMNGSDLYDESGYVRIGYAQSGSLVTSLGGQRVTLKK